MWWGALLLPTCVKSIQQFTLLPSPPFPCQFHVRLLCLWTFLVNQYNVLDGRASGLSALRLRPWRSWSQREGGGGTLHLGAPPLNGRRPVARTASSYWCHPRYRRPSDVCSAAVCLFLYNNSIFYFWRHPLFLCPYFSRWSPNITDVKRVTKARCAVMWWRF